MTRRITVKVYEDDNTTLVDTLASDRGRQWLDDLGLDSSYTIESKLGHADEAMLTDTRVLRFCIDDEPRWAGLVGPRNLRLADPNARQSGRVIGMQGVGLIHIFDDAVVLPELGFGRVSPDTRYFGWMSSYYDHTAWGNAVELKQQSDPDDTKPWYNAPRDFPDPDAYWVGHTDGDVPGADPGGGKPGDLYLWGTYTVPVGEGGDYQGATSADDAFRIFRDGDLEVEESRVGLWGVTRLFRFQMDEGSHFFAVKVTNFDRPDNSTNVFGFILSVAKMLGGGVAVGDVVARAASGTKMLAFPAAEPGLTVGAILIALIEENQAVGWHTDLTWDFTDTLDSDGVAWPDELNVSFQVGMGLLDVLKHFYDSHVAEFAMDPVGKVLHAYVQKGTDRTATVEVEYAVNVNRLAMSHVPPGKNSPIARTAEGRWVLYEDTAAVAAYGRRLVGLSMGAAPSDGSASRQVEGYLEDNANPVDAHTDLQVEDDAFIDGTVETGDLVIGPTAAGTATFRVHALRYSEDAAGVPIVAPELVKQ